MPSERVDAVLSDPPVAAVERAESFDQFCRAEQSKIANALGWTLGDTELGSEAAAEALTRAYERWDRVAVMENPSGWVFRTGLRWGQRRRWRTSRESALLLRFSRHEAVPMRPTDPDLFDALQRLPLDLRIVVVLRHLLDNSEQQTAELLAVPAGTVKSRLSRGLARLRVDLDVTEEGR